MARKLLLTLLIVALLIELALTGGAFFARAFTLKQFGVSLTADTAFLGYIVGWTLLFVSLVCGLATWQVWQRKRGFQTLCYLLGFWWIGIGIGIYVAFGKPDNLLLDSLKGLLLLILTNRTLADRRML
ncbi:hypothetical protein [Spirosoma luteum]|uniref:hypothetical protein n=1 Tax=Spirosoma luteum TaxID=431553 RepID=UPI00035E0E06|nr:hypothetical protein [Spirosoma luteum]